MGTHEVWKSVSQNLFLVFLEKFSSLPEDLNLPQPYFLATIFATKEELAIEQELDLFVNELLDKGVCYFVCGGNGGERLHDWVDETIVEREIDQNIKEPEDGHILTTDLIEDSLKEVVWFALNAAQPTEHYIKHKPPMVFFILNSSPYLSELKVLLKDLTIGSL